MQEASQAAERLKSQDLIIQKYQENLKTSQK